LRTRGPGSTSAGSNRYSSREVPGAFDLGDEKSPGGHVGEREPVGAVSAVAVANDRREVPRVVVGGFEEGTGRDNSGDLAGVTVVRLVLVGDGDPVAALDEGLHVRGQLRERHARHRVRRAVRGLL